jgi:sigma-B regulation protein RsbU (phosphoserine phosphatase)
MSDASAPFNLLSVDPAALDSDILRVLMDTIPDFIYFKDLQSRFVRNNAAHAHSLGANSPEECVGKTDHDFFSPEHAGKALADERHILTTGQPVIATVERVTLRDGSQTWGSTTKMPWRDRTGKIIGTFGVTRDITATKEAKDRLQEERNLLRTIIDNIPSRLYVKDLESRYVLNNRAHLQLLGLRDQAEAIGHTTADFFPGERGEQALADDRVVLEGGRVLNQEKSDFGAKGDVRWSLVTKVPLHDSHGRLTGLVGISHDITRRKIAEQELQRRTEEMETDLRMARQVQEAFLNRPYPVYPRTSGSSALRFAHRYLPATTLGGDFFDFVQVSDTKCGVLVCDVMGHGVRAGLLTALVRGIVEELAMRTADPAHVVSEINRSLMPIVERTGQPVFATVFFGVIDVTARRLCYANAGHPAPLVLRAGGNSIARLAPADPEPAAGLLAEFPYSHHECEFGPGDILLGYTDGVLEAANLQGEMFGEARISDFLRRARGTTPGELCERLVSEIETYSDREVFEDDVCIVAIEAAAE